MPEDHRTFREDRTYKSLDAQCRRLVTQRERALAKWLAETEIATTGERALKRAYETVNRAYERATARRAQRRGELRRKWFGGE